MSKPTTWRYPPRLITRVQLRGKLQIEDAELTLRMAKGQIPGPVWGCDAALENARWDVKAVDAAIDRESGVTADIGAEERELDNALGIRRA